MTSADRKVLKIVKGTFLRNVFLRNGKEGRTGILYISYIPGFIYIFGVVAIDEIINIF